MPFHYENEFVNPYYFAPVGEEMKDVDNGNLVRRLHDELPSVSEFREGALGHMTHALWRSETNSGRIVCRLETEGPMVIGGKQNAEGGGEQPTRVEPFRLDGRIAIPATSLRGMLSGLAEAASLSALRVLGESKPLSFRQDYRDGLSALGIIRQGEAGLELEPLAAPNFTAGHLLTQKWKRIFSRWRLKIFIGGYNGDSPSGMVETVLKQRESGKAKNEFWYLKGLPAELNERAKCGTDETLSLFPSDVKAKRKKNSDDPDLILGMGVSQHATLGTVKEPGAVRGYVRALGRRKGMPSGKKCEFFIPYPKDLEKEAMLPIPRYVIDNFEAMADERTDAEEDLPYQERHRPRHGPDNKLCPAPGDIVFFDVNDNGEIRAISYSSIWRGCVTNEARKLTGTHDFLAKAEEDCGRELRPFDNTRETITPAEALFGFASQEERKKQRKKCREAKAPSKKDGPLPLAYAGRVRVSFGEAEDREAAEGDGLLEKERIVLRALGAPKLPAPAMYFVDPAHPENAIAKKDLSPEKHRIQGRKFYVHDPARNTNTPPRWKTLNPGDKPKIKNSVRPVAQGAAFWFHVDFENLTDAELALLLFTLRPLGPFRHKLGMGKPLGLGTVRIDVCGLFLIDRRERYRVVADREENFLAPSRYGEGRATDSMDGAPERLYPREKAFASPESGSCERVEKLGEAMTYWKDLQKAAPITHKAIMLLGTDGAAEGRQGDPVAYPVAQGGDGETNGYEWFVNNDDRKAPLHGRRLLPLEKDDERLPRLKVNKRLPRP